MIRRRTALFVAAGTVLALLLALVVAIVATRFIDAKALRDRVVAEVSQQIGGDVSVGSLQVAILPLPHVVLDDVHVTIPGVAVGTIARISAYPQWLPLVRGVVQLSLVHLVNPTWNVKVPKASEPPPVESAPLTMMPQQFVAALATLSTTVGARAPDLTVKVTRGTLTVTSPDTADLQFTNLTAQITLSPRQLDFDLTCASTVADAVSASVTFDSTDSTGNARLVVNRLRPQHIPARLLPRAGIELGDSVVSLEVRVTTTGANRIDAVADAAVPMLVLARKDERLPLKDAHAQLELHHDEGAMRVTLRELQVASPPLHLSGSVEVNRTAGTAAFQVDAPEIDVESVRRAAHLLTIPVLTRIVDVLRGGKVSAFTIAARGAALADLGAAGALDVHGHLSHGQVHIPGIDLDLRDVTGDATVAGGMLNGEHLAATVGRSRAHDGTLRLGLSGSHAPLHVETQVEADASELPALLRRVSGNDAMDAQLDRISDVAGSAAGTLRLDGTTTDVDVIAEVARHDISGRVRDLSDPVHLSGGHVRYDSGAHTLRATDVRAALGSSVSSQLALQFDWSTLPWRLVVDAADSRLVLDDIYPQLTAGGWLRKSPENPDALRGVLALKSAHLSGPADTPSAWRCELIGTAQDLEIQSPLLSERIALRSPVSVSGLRLSRDPAADTVFSGTFSTAGEVSGSIDVRWNDAEIEVKRLQIRDHQSDASLSLRHAARTLDFGFKGRLDKSAVDALLPDNHLLGGSIRGDLQAQIQFDQPVESILHGTLQAEDVRLPIGGAAPLRAKRLSLDATGREIRLDSTLETEARDPLQVRGTVQAAAEAFIVDLDLTAGRLDWDHLAPMFAQQPDDDAASARPLPIRGSIEVAAESFAFRGVTWKPVHATVKLAGGATTVAVTDANLCGIATPGTIAVTPPEVQLAFEPLAQHQRLETTLECLGMESGAAIGEYSLNGHLVAHGPAADIGKALQGHVILEATKGRIHRLGTVAKILSAVSVATGSIGNVGDLGKEGFAYDVLKLKGDVQAAMLLLQYGVIDGPTAKMVAKGRIDVGARNVDLTVLVAPLRSVDTVVSHVPIVGTMLGGNLISVPVKVAGPWANPDIVPLAPSAVGTELTGLMKRTLKLPFKVIQPLLPGEKK